MFTVEQLEPAGVGQDGLRRWWVRMPDLRYDGKALAPSDWTGDQVLDALNSTGSKLGHGVMAGRLYSPTRLEAP